MFLLDPDIILDIEIVTRNLHIEVGVLIMNRKS